MPNSLETRVSLAAANLFGTPIGEAREIFKQFFHGPMIGGIYRAADVFYDPRSRTAIFVAGDVVVEVRTS